MTNREGKWNFSLSNGKEQIVENTGKLVVQKPSYLKRFNQKSSAFSIQLSEKVWLVSLFSLVCVRRGKRVRENGTLLER